MKYRKGDEDTFIDKISKLSMHSIIKKSNRVSSHLKHLTGISPQVPLRAAAARSSPRVVRLGSDPSRAVSSPVTDQRRSLRRGREEVQAAGEAHQVIHPGHLLVPATHTGKSRVLSLWSHRKEKVYPKRTSLGRYKQEPITWKDCLVPLGSFCLHTAK